MENMSTREDEEMGQTYLWKVAISRNKECQNGKMKSNIFGRKFILKLLYLIPFH